MGRRTGSAVRLCWSFIWIISVTVLGSVYCFPALASTFVKEGSATSKPAGHDAFCKVNPKQCKSTAPSKPETLTSKRMATLTSVNVAVNKSIKPVSDSAQFGKIDVWKAGVQSGDCEDYALTKRRKLIAAGFKSGNLRLTMGRLRSGEAHLVLMVRTDKGDFILDNLHNDVRPASQSGLRLIKMQSIAGGREWVTVSK